MNDTVRYINQEYGEYLKNFSYIAKKKYSNIQTGDILIGINSSNLKMDVNGIINKIEPNYTYLKIYSVSTKKYKIIYPENHYIFINRREKVKKKDKFKNAINDFIQKLEKN
jgi:hypothetical protein